MPRTGGRSLWRQIRRPVGSALAAHQRHRSGPDNEARGRSRGCRWGSAAPAPGLDEVRPQRAGWDLQAQTGEYHRVGLVDLAVLLHTQDLVQINAGNGDKGRSFLLGLDGELLV